jgi:hypothetical protein
VIDALIIDRAYQEEVDDRAAINISLVVDLSPLTHEQGINKLLEVREKASDRDWDSFCNEDDDGGDWEIDSETESDSDENISANDSSEYT